MTIGLFGQIETAAVTSPPVGRRDHLTFRGNATVGRHGWLRLTPAYSLGLVRELLKDARADDIVLEPFSGTGTTPLACASLGIPCDAVDINPFLVWLGNLKLTQFDNDMACGVRVAAKGIVEKLDNFGTDAWRPDLHAIEKWWGTPTLEVLAALWAGIKGNHCESGAFVTGLLSVAFCRVMIQTANVSFGHQSMSFKKIARQFGNPLVVETAEECARRICSAFMVEANEIAANLFVDPPKAAAHVYLGDSRQLPSALPAKRYTMVVTSPPYPNRMSYIRELRPYMYWLGFLSDGRAAGELDWKAIGGTWGCATSLLVLQRCFGSS